MSEEHPTVRKNVLEFILETPNELIFKYIEVVLKMMETNDKSVFMEVDVEGIGKIGLPVKALRLPEIALADLLFCMLTVKNLSPNDFPESIRPAVIEFANDKCVQDDLEAFVRGED